MYTGPAKSLADHHIKSNAPIFIPGSHIVQGKSIASASNCIFSVSLRLNTADDGRREQKDEEAAYGESNIAYFATSESGAAPWVESGAILR
jgi:hypothetical protein